MVERNARDCADGGGGFLKAGEKRDMICQSFSKGCWRSKVEWGKSFQAKYNCSYLVLQGQQLGSQLQKNGFKMASRIHTVAIGHDISIQKRLEG